MNLISDRPHAHLMALLVFMSNVLKELVLETAPAVWV